MSTLALLRAPRAPSLPHPILGPMGTSARVEGGCRYELRRIFGLMPQGNERLLPWILLNPSTADAQKNDPTLLRMIDFSHAWGFGGLIVLNLFPVRASRQADLRAWLRSARSFEMIENRLAVKTALQGHDAAMVAWGAGASGIARAGGIAGAIAAETAMWWRLGLFRPDLALYCLGTTQAGFPIHPLARGRSRVPAGMLPRSFALPPPVGVCRVCGCTDFDCSCCITRTGFACSWVEPNLCSACVPAADRRSA